MENEKAPPALETPQSINEPPGSEVNVPEAEQAAPAAKKFTKAADPDDIEDEIEAEEDDGELEQHKSKGKKKGR